MENCLITKLKSVVNNPNLQHDGEITLQFKGRATGKMSVSINGGDYSMFNFDGETHLILEGDAHFVNGNNENIGKEIVLGTSDVASIYIESTATLKKLTIYPCWNINTHNIVKNASRGFPSLPYLYDINGFERIGLIKNLDQLCFPYYRGDKTLEQLVCKDDYKFFCCNYGFNYLTGNVSVFGNNTKLATLYCQKCEDIDGTIESIIEGLYSKIPNDASNIALFRFSDSTRITLNGVGASDYKVKKDQNLVTIMLESNDSVVATYNGSTWTYNN